MFDPNKMKDELLLAVRFRLNRGEGAALSRKTGVPEEFLEEFNETEALDEKYRKMLEKYLYR